MVKQIEVANVRTTDNQNQAYIKLLKVTKKPITATIEIDVSEKGVTKRVSKTIKDGTDLYDLTKRDVYSDFIVNDIWVEDKNEYIQFSNGKVLRLGESIGDVDEDTIKRLQIRKTIEEHLDKEMKLNLIGIKVLSLFFIDRVANYRFYDEEGNALKGKYALMFEEEYERIIKLPKYQSLFEKHNHLNTPIEKIHDGYFSQDKKGQFKDSNESTSGELKSNVDDEDTFNRIMKNKEKLLNFYERENGFKQFDSRNNDFSESLHIEQQKDKSNLASFLREKNDLSSVLTESGDERYLVLICKLLNSVIVFDKINLEIVTAYKHHGNIIGCKVDKNHKTIELLSDCEPFELCINISLL